MRILGLRQIKERQKHFPTRIVKKNYVSPKRVKPVPEIEEKVKKDPIHQIEVEINAISVEPEVVSQAETPKKKRTYKRKKKNVSEEQPLEFNIEETKEKITE